MFKNITLFVKGGIHCTLKMKLLFPLIYVVLATGMIIVFSMKKFSIA